MTTITQFLHWVDEDLHPAQASIEYVTVAANGDGYQGTPVFETEIALRLYTYTNAYTIKASEDGDTYLGCTAKSRKPRPGETWQRGGDLPDGRLSRDTWQRIVCGIIRYEMQGLSADAKVKTLAEWSAKVATEPQAAITDDDLAFYVEGTTKNCAELRCYEE